MLSFWGVDHGDEVSKSAGLPDKYNRNGSPSAGRRVSGTVFSGYHGLGAGKKGKKIRAAGNEFGGTVAGSLAGGAAAGLATAGRVKNPKALYGLTFGASTGGAVAGSQLGVNRNQRRGYYKPQGR